MENIIGKKFGRLTVLELAYKKDYKPHYKCRCECGNETIVSKSNLQNGHTKSCGCLRKKSRKYDSTTIKLLYVFNSMRSRCYNPKNKAYKNYGLRNIKIFDEWLIRPLSFVEWAINNGYKDNLTIDRIDNNKGYYPENCRWVDMKTQCRNRRSNYYITYKNEKYCLTDLAKKYNIGFSTLKHRLKIGWDIEKALFKEVTPNGK